MFINAAQIQVGDFVRDNRNPIDPDRYRSFFATAVFFEDDDPSEFAGPGEVKIEHEPVGPYPDDSYATGYIWPARHIVVVDRANEQSPLCNICDEPLFFVANYGAPGFGQEWECKNGHAWAKVHGIFVDPNVGAHIMEIS